jgi:hypothetical protein
LPALTGSYCPFTGSQSEISGVFKTFLFDTKLNARVESPLFPDVHRWYSVLIFRMVKTLQIYSCEQRLNGKINNWNAIPTVNIGIQTIQQEVLDEYHGARLTLTKAS